MAAKHNFEILAVLTPLLLAAPVAHAATVRSLVTVAGAPKNQLVGYGLVVGLPGTGDQTTEIPFTQQAITNMLSHEGVTLSKRAFMQPKDDASVMITATIPPYAQQGNAINVTVSALGNAKSLAGGVLLPTPLKGGNGKVYAQAQGALLVSGFAAGANGTSSRTNSPTVGHIPNGAVLSRRIPTASWGKGNHAALLLRRPSFGNASRIANAINRSMGRGTAFPKSPDRIALHDTRDPNNPVKFMAAVMNVQVTPQQQAPTVVVDAQSGTIVMGAGVTLGPAVVSHGNLTVRIQTSNGVSQPAPLSNGKTAGARNSRVSAKQKKHKVVTLPHATTLKQVAAALNRIGATPSDLVAIVQSLKEAGALKAHLKVE